MKCKAFNIILFLCKGQVSKTCNKNKYLFFLVLLERTHECCLLLVGLEPSVTKLGGCVNELKVDNFQGPLLGVGEQGLSQCQNPFLWSNATALEHQEVLLDLSVVREAAHGVDGFV